MLELKNVSKHVEGEWCLKDISLSLGKGSLNVLLGPTLAGKTSLMRIMAGLDQPTEGTVYANGRDVTGVFVRERNVAMVYQQFINYPALSVYENIASPLRMAGANFQAIDSKVRKTADLLKLTPYLDRRPLSLSGGQQQRTALARAIVKNADVVLLDEPLANLDYKLREELREELPKIFAETGAVFIYATTEPSEALLLGGNTATLSKGRLTQFGPTVDVFRFPADLVTAQTFSDPPINIVTATKVGHAFKLDGSSAKITAPANLQGIADGAYTLGFRPHHLSLSSPGKGATPLRATVDVTEITGSESYIHLNYAGNTWIMLTHGIHNMDEGTQIDIYVDPRRLIVFGQSGKTVTGGEKYGG